MIYRTLGNSGLKVTDITLGALNFGTKVWGCDEGTSCTLMNMYLEAGGNFIDTSNSYGGGESEKIVGRFFKNNRDSVIIATKCCAPTDDNINHVGSSRVNILNQVHGSLKRLNTDYIDLLYLHLWDPTTPFLESLSTLTELVKSGKVRYLGLCNFTGWQISEMAGLWKHNSYLEPVIALQNQYNLVSRSMEYEVVPTCIYNNIGLVAYSPVAGGVLAGVYDLEKGGPKDSRYSDAALEKTKRNYVTQRNLRIYGELKKISDDIGLSTVTVASAWLLQNPSVASMIIGPRKIEQFQPYISACTTKLSDEVINRLDNISKPDSVYPYYQQAKDIPLYFGRIQNLKKLHST